jgi:hypothetical protein
MLIKRKSSVFTVLILALSAICIMVFAPSRAKAAGPYEIGVYYFSNWNPELSPFVSERSEGLYGRSDWFGGVKDMLTSPGPWGYGPLADRESLLGWYDDRQQSILDQHILQAASRGIDHFAFYYYWDWNGGSERPGQNINKFDASPYKDLLDYYIYFVADGVWPQSDWVNYIVPSFINHIQNSSYKKTSDGRPIIGFYGDMISRLGGTNASVKTAMDYLRAQCISNGLGDPWLLYNGYSGLNNYIAQGYDGFLPLNLAGIGITDYVPGDYSAYQSAWPSFVTMYNGYTMVPGAISGFDPRPWRGTGYVDASLAQVYTDPNPEKFRGMLQQVKTYLDDNPASKNMATLYAWNELGEGGAIEPSTLFGYGYINAIQEVFGLSNSAYKAKVALLGLTDIAPVLRVEARPDIYTLSPTQSFKIKVKTKNYYSSSVTSGTVSLNAGGWAITASSNTSLNGLASGAVKDTEFTVIAESGTAWTKFPMTVNVSYNVGGVNYSQSVDTFVIPNTTTNSLMTDSFDSGTLGAAPAGWTLNTSGGTVTIQAVPGTAYKSMRMYKSSANANYAASSKKFTQQNSGTVIVDTHVMVSETSSKKQIMVRDYAGSNIAGSIAFKDGSIMVNETTALQSFTANTWYRITLKLNVAAKTYEVLINDVSKGTFSFYNTSTANLGEVLYVISPSFMGTLHVNDAEVGTQTALLTDNFNSGTVGTAPSGWTVNSSGGTVTIQAIPSASDKSVRMNKTSANANYAAASKTFTQQSTGIVTVDTQVMVPETASKKQILVRDYAGINIAGSIAFKDGNIMANETATLQAFTANTWYQITLKLNVVAKTYEVLVNNVSKGTFNFYHSSASSIGEVLYVISPSFMGSLNVSSITVAK